MKIGLVGYQGGGKSTVFELLTGVRPDPAKAHSGQLGVAVVPDERFDRLVRIYKPKKTVPARIELFDTPGLDRGRHEGNAQKLGVIRESAALVQVIGVFAGADPAAEAAAFQEDLILADLQIVANRMDRLKKDVTKPRPDREQLQHELDALRPVAERLEHGQSLLDVELAEVQEKACRSFALLTRKRRLLLLNTADAQFDERAVRQLEAQGHSVVAAPAGLELEVDQLPADERAEFAAEMGLGEPCRERLLRAIFTVTGLITFFTCDEKEVHAWLLKSGSTAVDAADSIHSDLARGFIRAEITKVADLIRLGGERAVKAAGLVHTEGKDYVMQDGDEIVVRSGI
ncbi:MAG: DUF933 domain-containing protein [Planctomycetaceae bacterium]